tara:strand:+ start:2622 stop:3038 length:417 start_codon:yes stop_codon:yes gene_type:complete
MKETLFTFIIVLTCFSMLAEDDLIFSEADNQILPAKEAFGFNFIKSSGNIIATWNVKKDYYLYLRSVSVKDIDGEIKYKILKGNAIDYKDEFFGDTKIIKDILEISYEESHQKGKTKIYYQGCSEKGFCYPVQSINIK